MTPAEAAAVLGWAAAIDGREESEIAAEAWASALNPRLSIADAKWIITDHYSRETWKVMPAHINEKYRQVRHDRVKDMRAPEPPEALEGNPVRENAWRVAYVRLIGDGLTEAQADVQACAEHGVTRPAVEASPRPLTAILGTHKAGCPCGCLTRPIRTEERR